LDLLKNFQKNLNTYKYLISGIVYVPLGPPTAMIDTKPVPLSCPQIANGANGQPVLPVPSGVIKQNGELSSKPNV